MSLVVRPAPYGGPVAQALIARLQAEYVQRYGEPDETPVDAAEFTPPSGQFLVCYDGSALVAGGGWRVSADVAGAAEIKRMYVPAALRRRGYARRLLAALEADIAAAGFARVVLESATLQPEAIAMYDAAGYERIAPFGFYAGHAMSVYFGKSLMTGVR